MTDAGLDNRGDNRERGAPVFDLLPDKLKSVVTMTDRYDLIINESLQALSPQESEPDVSQVSSTEVYRRYLRSMLR